MNINIAISLLCNRFSPRFLDRVARETVNQWLQDEPEAVLGLLIAEMQTSTSLYRSQALLELLLSIPRGIIESSSTMRAFCEDLNCGSVFAGLCLCRQVFIKCTLWPLPKPQIGFPIEMAFSEIPKGELSLEWLNGQHKDVTERFLLTHFSSQSVMQDEPEKVIHELEQCAQRNDADAQYVLALTYFDGYKVEQNIQRGLQLLGMSGTQGSSEAKCALGVLYVLGYNVTQDIQRGKHLLRDAAGLGNRLAAKVLQSTKDRGV
jgi:hypothetical protein